MSKKIGDVAAELDVSIDTLRYYEKIHLLGQVPRSNSAVRFYDEALIARIRFIRHAQRMGFSLEAIKELLDFRDQPMNAKPQVREMIQQKLITLNQQIQDLSQLRDELQALTRACEYSEDPDCPILKEFEK
ncbi:MAG: heavy metal-responsive transcriptional regulator [Cellvibrionaceae bacterium]